MKLLQAATIASAVFVLTGIGTTVYAPIAVQTVSAAGLTLVAPTEPTDRPAEVYQGSFLDSSVTAMLNHLGVTVSAEDKVYAFPDPSLHVGSQIHVYRAQPVEIVDGTTEQLAATWSKTVGDLVAEHHLELGDKDTISPSVDTLLTLQKDPIVISITRVAEAQITVTSDIPFSTQYQDDDTMDKGTQSIQQKGENGTLEKVYLVRRENGVEVSRRLLSQTTTKQPVPQIVKRGTRVTTYGTGGASWYGGVAPMTAANLTLPKGTKVRVVDLANGKSVIVTIADRGPYVTGRIIDLSSDAFAQLAPLGAGVISVRLEAVN